MCMEKLEIQDDLNFIRFNGRVYSLNDIGKCSLNDVIETSKQFFENRANEHIEAIGQEVRELALAQEHQQLEHIAKLSNRASCCVPSSEFQKMVVAYGVGHQYCRARATIFCPQVLSIGKFAVDKMKNSIRDSIRGGVLNFFPTECRSNNGEYHPKNIMIGTGYHDEFKKMVLDIEETSVTYRVVVERFMPAQVLHTIFDGSHIKIINFPWINIATPHQMYGSTLCTGNINAKTYWELGNDLYNSSLNLLNYDSLASNYFEYMNEIGDVIKLDCIKMLRALRYITFQREESTSWRT